MMYHVLELQVCLSARATTITVRQCQECTLTATTLVALATTVATCSEQSSKQSVLQISHNRLERIA
jgi:hypothetical protein